MQEHSKRRFRDDPACFLEESINKYVLNSSLNRLPAFEDTPIFEEPLVGFADGDDPIFQEYKALIGDFHLTPRETLARHLDKNHDKNPLTPSAVSVISSILPIHKATRLSNRTETKGPSLRWNHTRWQGQALINELCRYIIFLLEERGFRATAPEMEPFFQMTDLSNGLSSTWSQRHIAYAAGLGTFGLSDGFITPKGIAMRCSSVVTDARLPASSRPYTSHVANCLFYSDGSCHRCRERCPGGAITEKGHDKKKCLTTLIVKQKPWMEGVYGQGYIGSYAGCGLCQTGTPCEDRIPEKNNRNG